MEFIAAGMAVVGGCIAGVTVARSSWPVWGRTLAVLGMTGLVFFLGSRLGAWAVMQQAGEAVTAQVGSVFLSVFSGITWAVVGALLFLGGMPAGALWAKARRSREV